MSEQNNQSKDIAAVVVSIKENGAISIDLPDEFKGLGYSDIEELLRRAHQKLVENRLITTTVNLLTKKETEENATDSV
jgi:hypothetical protein